MRLSLHCPMRFAIVACLAVLFLTPALSQLPDRTAPPPLGPPPSFTHAPLQRFVLSDGLPVILMEKHDVPLVQITLMIRAGHVSEPEGKTGLASMVATMLKDGAGSRDALELADAIDYLGATLSTGAGYHSTSLALSTPLSKLDSALALLVDVALRPTFPPAELERRRKERLTTLLQWRDEPRALASVMFLRSLYGDSHPYGGLGVGTERTIRSLAVTDLREFHAAHFRPNNAVLIVVGDVTVSTMRPKLEAGFAGWQPTPLPARSLPDIRQVSGRTIFLVDKPGAAQTEIRLGCIGVPRTNVDFFPLEVMNTILGGSFSSRLNQNLREQHGYTYGAGSRFDYRILPGPFLASAAVHTAITDSALLQFMKELQDIRKPLPGDDVVRGKNYMALGFPGAFQSVEQIADMLEDLALYNLPDDYYNLYVDRTLRVQGQDIERVARTYLDPERMIIVLVGDRKAIEKGVAALKLGPIKNRTVEDVLGKAPQL